MGRGGGASGLDAELENLMGKLNTIQQAVGGGVSESKDEGPARTGDRFLDLKADMVRKLNQVHSLDNPPRPWGWEDWGRGWLGVYFCIILCAWLPGR